MVALGLWDKLSSVLCLHQLLMTRDKSLPRFGPQFPCLDNEGLDMVLYNLPL